MKLRCPHCRHAVEVVEDSSFKDVKCPSCNSHFSILGDEATTQTHRAEARKLGHFQLIEKIGVGAFGSVWKARDTKLDRIAAIKIPRKEQLSEKEAELFMRDARAAAQLKHPNIVGVHEVGREGDTIYIAMDYVEGADLKQWLKGESLPPAEAATLMANIAAAVEHAHCRGVTHRDLKPENIMMDRQGQPYVMDFGLAKRESGEMTMTVDGATLGTPAYMSPEQAAGKSHEADARSDVYSLGVILFELLTGTRPFHGEKRMLILQILDDDPPRVRKLNSRVPKDVETVCLKCLRKEPEKRYQSAASFAADLSRYLGNEPVHARPVSRIEKSWLWCKRRPGLVGSAMVITLVLMASTLAILWQRAESERQRIVERMATTLNSLETASGSAVPLVLSYLSELPREGVLAELQSRFSRSSAEQRLNLAYGLAHFGQVEVNTLINGLVDSDTAPGEVNNIVAALRHSRPEAVNGLQASADEATHKKDWVDKARLAVVALHLGDEKAVAEMLSDGPREAGQPFDPIQRTIFIREFESWSGQVDALARVLADSEDPAVRSGICLAIGRVEKPGRKTKEAWQPVLGKWFVMAVDAGTHSAAGWAMEKWKLETPDSNQTKQPSADRNWWHEPNGLRFVKINARGPKDEEPPTTNRNGYWLSDTEVTVGIFRKFMEDQAYHQLHPELKPNWPGPTLFKNYDSPDLPVQKVSWYDALLFCNWLSWRLGLEPCYEIAKPENSTIYDVVWRRDADGIRLPILSEWETACRAATTTRFSFGDDEEHLIDYGWFANNGNSRTHLVRKKLCNAWGLFDMHGNLWEWCWSEGSVRKNRGGSWNDSAIDCLSSYASRDVPFLRDNSLGFRVAQGSVSETESETE